MFFFSFYDLHYAIVDYRAFSKFLQYIESCKTLVSDRIRLRSRKSRQYERRASGNLNSHGNVDQNDYG